VSVFPTPLFVSSASRFIVQLMLMRRSSQKLLSLSLGFCDTGLVFMMSSSAMLTLHPPKTLIFSRKSMGQVHSPLPLMLYCVAEPCVYHYSASIGLRARALLHLLSALVPPSIRSFRSRSIRRGSSIHLANHLLDGPSLRFWRVLIHPCENSLRIICIQSRPPLCFWTLLQTLKARSVCRDGQCSLCG
jgi:hypothetical protein